MPPHNVLAAGGRLKSPTTGDRLKPVLQGTAAAWEPTAEEIHPLFQRQREPTADQFLELSLALDLECSQGLLSLATCGGRIFAFASHC